MKDSISERIIKLIFYLLPAIVQAQMGIEGEEVDAITNLIEATTTQLEAQKELKQHMLRFLAQKKQFMKGENEKVIGFQMVQTAKNILTILTNEHLITLFSQEYLDELKFFSTLTEKK